MLSEIINLPKIILFLELSEKRDHNLFVVKEN